MVPWLLNGVNTSTKSSGPIAIVCPEGLGFGVRSALAPRRALPATKPTASRIKIGRIISSSLRCLSENSVLPATRNQSGMRAFPPAADSHAQDAEHGEQVA